MGRRLSCWCVRRDLNNKKKPSWLIGYSTATPTRLIISIANLFSHPPTANYNSQQPHRVLIWAWSCTKMQSCSIRIWSMESDGTWSSISSARANQTREYMTEKEEKEEKQKNLCKSETRCWDDVHLTMVVIYNKHVCLIAPLARFKIHREQCESKWRTGDRVNRNKIQVHALNWRWCIIPIQKDYKTSTIFHPRNIIFAGTIYAHTEYKICT